MDLFLAGIALGFAVPSLVAKYLKYRVKRREQALNEKLEKHFKDGV